MARLILIAAWGGLAASAVVDVSADQASDLIRRRIARFDHRDVPAAPEPDAPPSLESTLADRENEVLRLMTSEATLNRRIIDLEDEAREVSEERVSLQVELPSVVVGEPPADPPKGDKPKDKKAK